MFYIERELLVLRVSPVEALREAASAATVKVRGPYRQTVSIGVGLAGCKSRPGQRHHGIHGLIRSGRIRQWLEGRYRTRAAHPLVVTIGVTDTNAGLI